MPVYPREEDLPKYAVFEEGESWVRRAIRFVPCDCLCHTANWDSGPRTCAHCEEQRKEANG